MFQEAYEISCKAIDMFGYAFYKMDFEKDNYNNMPTVAIKIAKKFGIINDDYLKLAIRLFDLEYIKLYLESNRNKRSMIEDMVINTRNLLFIDNFMYKMGSSKKLLEADYDIRWNRNNNFNKVLR